MATNTINMAEVSTSTYSNSATVTVNISPAFTQASSVKVAAVSGTTATATTDYTVSGLTSVTTSGGRISGTLALPQDATSASFTVTAVADMETDGYEFIWLNLQAIDNAPYTIRQATLEIAIIDNSVTPRTVSLTATPNPVAEGSDVTVRATLSSAATDATAHFGSPPPAAAPRPVTTAR